MKNLITAMKCDKGIYRVEDETKEYTQVFIYDSYEELTEAYKILGVLTPSVSLTFVVQAI